MAFSSYKTIIYIILYTFWHLTDLLDVINKITFIRGDISNRNDSDKTIKGYSAIDIIHHGETVEICKIGAGNSFRTLKSQK
jgi:hypothetical protein